MWAGDGERIPGGEAEHQHTALRLVQHGTRLISGQCSEKHQKGILTFFMIYNHQLLN